MEKIYLYIKLTKILLLKGYPKNILQANNYSFKCMELCTENNCHSGLLTAMILNGVTDYRIHRSIIYKKKFKLATESANELKLDRIVNFLEKVNPCEIIIILINFYYFNNLNK